MTRFTLSALAITLAASMSAGASDFSTVSEHPLRTRQSKNMSADKAPEHKFEPTTFAIPNKGDTDFIHAQVRRASDGTHECLDSIILRDKDGAIYQKELYTYTETGLPATARYYSAINGMGDMQLDKMVNQVYDQLGRMTMREVITPDYTYNN